MKGVAVAVPDRRKPLNADPLGGIDPVSATGRFRPEAAGRWDSRNSRSRFALALEGGDGIR